MTITPNQKSRLVNLPDGLNADIESLIKDILYILNERIGNVHLLEDKRTHYTYMSISTLGHKYDIYLSSHFLSITATLSSEPDDMLVEQAVIKRYFTSSRYLIEPVLILVEDQTQTEIWPEWWESVETSK